MSRQHKMEHASSANVAANSDGSPLRCDDSPRERETQPGACWIAPLA